MMHNNMDEYDDHTIEYSPAKEIANYMYSYKSRAPLRVHKPTDQRAEKRI